MSNSSQIAFGLLIGFIVYITVRGELPAYLCVIGIGANCSAPPANQTQSAPQSSGSNISAPSGNSGVNSSTTITAPNNPFSTGSSIGLPSGLGGLDGLDGLDQLPVYPGGSPILTGSESTITYGEDF